jgi:hypothetical protein
VVDSLKISGFSRAWVLPTKVDRVSSDDGLHKAELRIEDRSRRSRREAWVTGSIPFLSNLFLIWVFQ